MDQESLHPPHTTRKKVAHKKSHRPPRTKNDGQYVHSFFSYLEKDFSFASSQKLRPRKVKEATWNFIALPLLVTRLPEHSKVETLETIWLIPFWVHFLI